MSVEFLPDLKYKFVAGRGDDDHEMRISDAAAKGYRVKSITHNPEGVASNQGLVVLMEKNEDANRRS